MSDRNAEIWSNRLQKELLALTTETSNEEESQGTAAPSLPSFITFKEHHLDIAAGVCTVTFLIDIPNPKAQEEEESDDKIIIITLDTSMDRSADGVLTPNASAYPFKRPTAILVAGSSMFPESSTIQNGNTIDIDCDWTPSLHLTDAILNIGLKIKESILMGESFHPAATPVEDSDPVDDLVKGARRFGSFLTKSARTFGVTVAPPVVTDEEVPAQRSNPLRRKPKEPKKQASSTSIKIGDEINMMEAPWVDCKGLYSCKAIRRPGFIEDAIALAAKANNEVSSNWDDDEDGGEIPGDFGNYMRLQAGSLSKVCVLLLMTLADTNIANSTFVARFRLLVPVSQELEPCSVPLHSRPEAWWKSPS